MDCSYRDLVTLNSRPYLAPLEMMSWRWGVGSDRKKNTQSPRRRPKCRKALLWQRLIFGHFYFVLFFFKKRRWIINWEDQGGGGVTGRSPISCNWFDLLTRKYVFGLIRHLHNFGEEENSFMLINSLILNVLHWKEFYQFGRSFNKVVNWKLIKILVRNLSSQTVLKILVSMGLTWCNIILYHSIALEAHFNFSFKFVSIGRSIRP